MLYRIENHCRSYCTRLRQYQLNSIPEAEQFPNHLGGPALRPRAADGWAAFLRPGALMQNLPDQTPQPMRNGPDGSGAPKAGD